MAKSICTQPDCAEYVVGRGLCRKHYVRWHRHGDPSIRLRQRDPGDASVRWMAKVEVQSPGCWMWTAGLGTDGYGAYDQGHAHRKVYEILVGPIPAGLQLDHLCRQRACVNPDHLEPVTSRVNVARGVTGSKIKNSEEYRRRRAAYMRDYMRRKRAEGSKAPA